MTRQLSNQTQQQTSTTSPLSSGILQRKCVSCGQHMIAGGECGECQKKRSPLQRRASSQAEPSEVPPIVYEVLRSPGQPLDPDTRAFMEPRFGQDFSSVRVHANDDAARSADAIHALAYTLGKHIVFQASSYAPTTAAGRKLLAHELTHVVQQAGKTADAVATQSVEMSQPDSRLEQEADDVAETMMSMVSTNIPVQIHQRSAVPFLGRQNFRETANVIRTGTVRGTGIQFFPVQVVSTRIGPVSGEGGLLNDSRNRLSVIVGQSMTLRRIANIILPLWNSATPFTPSGSTTPLVTPNLSADVLARGLLIYNRYYLQVRTQPAVTMSGWRGGLRLPLPVEIDLNGEGVVNKDLIVSLASEFENSWESLLDQSAAAVVAPTAVDLRQSVSDFLTSHRSIDERGLTLATRTITNPVEAQPFVIETFAQLGTGGFDVALSFLDWSINSQLALSASQRAGAAILAAIRAALSSPPTTLSAHQQESLDRANRMLGQISALVPRDMPFLQPTAVSTAVSTAGVHMIADFEGFCPNLYDDAMRGCGRGRGNCTVGFGHLVHLDPCDGRASEAPFAGGITRQQGEQLLANELVRFVNDVRNQVMVPISQEQFDALVSFHFNTGRLNALLPDLNNNRFANVPGIMNQFIRGRVGNQHIVMQGLVARRAAEATLFSSGQYPPP